MRRFSSESCHRNGDAGSTSTSTATQEPTATSTATIAAPSATAAAVGTAVTTSDLNMREEPDANSALIVVIPNNTEVEILGEPQNGFYPVRYQDQEGWASVHVPRSRWRASTRLTIRPRLSSISRSAKLGMSPVRRSSRTAMRMGWTTSRSSSKDRKISATRA